MPGKSIGESRREGFETTANQQSDKDYMDKAVRDTVGIVNARNEGEKKADAFIANLGRTSKKPVRRTTSRSGGR